MAPALETNPIPPAQANQPAIQNTQTRQNGKLTPPICQYDNSYTIRLILNHELNQRRFSRLFRRNLNKMPVAEYDLIKALCILRRNYELFNKERLRLETFIDGNIIRDWLRAHSNLLRPTHKKKVNSRPSASRAVYYSLTDEGHAYLDRFEELLCNEIAKLVDEYEKRKK